jgi:hypothetical protein
MRRLRLAGLLLIALLATVGTAWAANRNIEASLSGGEEVPARVTGASGRAKFKLSDDGTELHYELAVANITNVVQAHIHIGAPGVNGPIVAFLYGPVAPAGGPIRGRIASGTITAEDLLNTLAGHPLSDLVDAIRAGNAYVNVHTNDGVDPTNTGPGDFQSGEIRGQMHSDHGDD